MKFNKASLRIFELYCGFDASFCILFKLKRVSSSSLKLDNK